MAYTTAYTTVQAVIQRISEKNVTNLILNNFDKLEPISIIFARALVGLLLQITIIFSYRTSCELTLPCNISEWRI